MKTLVTLLCMILILSSALPRSCVLFADNGGNLNPCCAACRTEPCSCTAQCCNQGYCPPCGGCNYPPMPVGCEPPRSPDLPCSDVPCPPHCPLHCPKGNTGVHCCQDPLVPWDECAVAISRRCGVSYASMAVAFLLVIGVAAVILSHGPGFPP